MDNTTMANITRIARKVRDTIISEYGTVENMCIVASTMIQIALLEIGIVSDMCHGWCLYDTTDNSTGDPISPHCYLLIPVNGDSWYLDVTGDQFNLMLDTPQPEIILLRNKLPYWVHPFRPTLV